MAIIVVGCGVSAATLKSAIKACNVTCATDAIIDAVVDTFEIHNCYPYEEDFLIKRENDKPHYRDLEYSKKNKKKRI